MKIKILHLTSTRYGIGGVENLLLDMSDKYDFSRFDLSYCNLFCDNNNNGVFPTALKQRGLRYFDIKGNSWYQVPQMTFDLLKLLKREKFDIVHTHMLGATIIGQATAKMAQSPCKIVTKHYTDDVVKHNRLIKKLDLQLTRTSDRIIAISEWVKNDMLSQGIPESKISLILNGIDLNLFKLPSAENDGDEIKKSEFVIGSVGSLTKRKGHQYLIEALPRILEKHPQARVVIIGEGPEESNLRKLMKQLNVEDKVTLKGFQKEVFRLLREFDLYVHPSINEPFGIAILEAMAAQKCVVATTVEGIPEIVIDGETGFLIAPMNPFELSLVICCAIENSDETKMMGEKGRKRVEDCFRIEKTVEKYQNLYIASV